ncbi:MAG: ribbon-helix-helix protein, CopG family [Eubacteriales bacterium]|nr:ribbon-helix-helix protein, CopG family [Eubacteriales bacterium]
MARPRKESVPISIKLEKNIKEKLEEFCLDSGQTKTAAVERALVAYIDDYYKNQAKTEERK